MRCLPEPTDQIRREPPEFFFFDASRLLYSDGGRGPSGSSAPLAASTASDLFRLLDDADPLPFVVVVPAAPSSSLSFFACYNKIIVDTRSLVVDRFFAFSMMFLLCSSSAFTGPEISREKSRDLSTTGFAGMFPPRRFRPAEGKRSGASQTYTRRRKILRPASQQFRRLEESLLFFLLFLSRSLC